MKLPVDLAGIARFILSDQCKSIVILTGAGVSCASGIPDFRSPGEHRQKGGKFFSDVLTYYITA